MSDIHSRCVPTAHHGRLSQAVPHPVPSSSSMPLATSRRPSAVFKASGVPAVGQQLLRHVAQCLHDASQSVLRQAIYKQTPAAQCHAAGPGISFDQKEPASLMPLSEATCQPMRTVPPHSPAAGHLLELAGAVAAALVQTDSVAAAAGCGEPAGRRRRPSRPPGRPAARRPAAQSALDQTLSVRFYKGYV